MDRVAVCALTWVAHPARRAECGATVTGAGVTNPGNIYCLVSCVLSCGILCRGKLDMQACWQLSCVRTCVHAVPGRV